MIDLLRGLGAMRITEQEGSFIEVETALPPAGIHPALREILRRSADPASEVTPARAFAPEDERTKVLARSPRAMTDGPAGRALALSSDQDRLGRRSDRRAAHPGEKRLRLRSLRPDSKG
jgi:hypothetical protein